MHVQSGVAENLISHYNSFFKSVVDVTNSLLKDEFIPTAKEIVLLTIAA